MATTVNHSHANGVAPPLTLAGVTDAVCRIIEAPTPKYWWPAFGAANVGLLILLAMVGYLVTTGVGVWGLNNRIGWCWDITNFVFWVGIGHAGTLISAILFLFRQNWRTSINRAAEAMTIFAVICALLFPTIHVGEYG
jgi:Ni/Fe-hydrogenase subunit HybB-like protein